MAGDYPWHDRPCRPSVYMSVVGAGPGSILFHGLTVTLKQSTIPLKLVISCSYSLMALIATGANTVCRHSVIILTGVKLFAGRSLQKV